MEWAIVPMQKGQVGQVAALEECCFSRPWSALSLKNELKNPRAAWLVAIAESGEVVGYGGLHWVLDEGEIINIATAPKWRRCGVALSLLRVLLSRAADLELRRITLEVRASNAAAQELYAQLGFVPAGLRRGYYTEPAEDAVLMAWDMQEQ